jgi:transcription elongation GreA/GreB family factor
MEVVCSASQGFARAGSNLLILLAQGSALAYRRNPMNSDLQKLVAAGKLSPADAEKLNRLEPGTPCNHKSWGVGKISEWDLLGDRVLIDFETKSGHPMKLSFAADSLTPLAANHLLALRITDLDNLKKMAKEAPAKLVEMALQCSGNKIHLDDLEKMLTPAVVDTGAYKKWWESTKKALKEVRHIAVPSKRTDLMTMRDQADKPSDVLVKAFTNTRELKPKLTSMAAIIKDLDLFDDAANQLQPVFEDINFVTRRSWKLQLKESLQLLLQRDELAETVKATLPENSHGIIEIMRETRGQLAEVINSLPAGLVGRAYRAFPETFPEGEWVKDALGHLTRTSGRTVGEIAGVLDENNQLDVLVDFLRKSVRNRTLSTELLLWLVKERKGLAETVFDMDLGHAMLDSIEDDHMRGGPKRAGRLGEVFSSDKTLLEEMVVEADDEELRLLANRLLNTPVFDELTRRSLMGKMIKARPELEQLMQQREEARKDEALVVSWTSLEAKKKELEDLISVKIPQNKKDIEIARSYGDLRENFEYHSAKQQQSVLLRMQSKYERDLRHAQGTDFAGVSGDSVVVGTIVDLEMDDGNKDTYTVLGAWDSNPDKHILSYLSEMGKALIGAKVGDSVQIPSESGQPRTVKVLAIRPYNP